MADPRQMSNRNDSTCMSVDKYTHSNNRLLNGYIWKYNISKLLFPFRPRKKLALFFKIYNKTVICKIEVAYLEITGENTKKMAISCKLAVKNGKHVKLLQNKTYSVEMITSRHIGLAVINASYREDM